MLGVVVLGSNGGWFGSVPEERDPAEAQAAWERLWPEPIPGVGRLNDFSVMRYHVIDDEEPMDAGDDLVVPVIDGIPLFEMLGDRWPGVPGEWVLPPSGQWLGAPDQVEYGRPIVLDGSCGDAGCCGVVARISVLANTVIWDEFHGHGSPDLPEPLRFEFDRANYEEQLRAVLRISVTEWVVT
jgi:hypothetical protein